MNRELRIRLERAIEKVIENNAEEGWWDGYIHEGLCQQMTAAAVAVFDASMDGQSYMKAELK
jgi:hypothetical protein